MICIIYNFQKLRSTGRCCISPKLTHTQFRSSKKKKFLQNLYVGLEATVKTGHGTMIQNWERTTSRL